MSHGDFVSELSTWSEADQLKATILLKDFNSKALAVAAEDEENILDSGSGRHINRKVRILDPDSSVSLTGFDDSRQWTQGSGFLPLAAQDEFTNEEFKFDIVGVISSIFSLGNLTPLYLQSSLSASSTRMGGTFTSTKMVSSAILQGVLTKFISNSETATY